MRLVFMNQLVQYYSLTLHVNIFVLNSMDNKSSRSPGRPRTFDRDNVLDRAITTFWANGYNGSSLDDLTETMGIGRPSLYATFGSKHGLFMEVIDRYAATFGCQPINALQGEPDINKAVSAFFEASIRCVTSRDGPKGCLIASVAAVETEQDEQVRDKLNGMLAETDRVIADRFLAAQGQGQISRDSDPRALARLVISITHSFATRARFGAGRKELSRLAKDFMAVLFPKSN
jgi:AcrR family transcriptional regulator